MLQVPHRARPVRTRVARRGADPLHRRRPPCRKSRPSPHRGGTTSGRAAPPSHMGLMWLQPAAAAPCRLRTWASSAACSPLSPPRSPLCHCHAGRRAAAPHGGRHGGGAAHAAADAAQRLWLRACLRLRRVPKGERAVADARPLRAAPQGSVRRAARRRRAAADAQGGHAPPLPPPSHLSHWCSPLLSPLLPPHTPPPISSRPRSARRGRARARRPPRRCAAGRRSRCRSR